MSFELAAYGMIAGKLYYESKWKCWSNLYYSLITAMIGGRIVWGITYGIFCGVAGQTFTLGIFLASAVINAVPGIVLQLLFVPVLVKALHHTGVVWEERHCL